jgi:cytoskeleton protein RodZ
MTPPDAEITELPSSPGARLRRERESRGMTEQQAAEALNLDPAAVASLEANDYSALGAPVFVRGHLRRYALLLGLPDDDVVGAYDRARQQVDEPSLVPRSRLEMMPVRNKPRWPWVIGGALAFLLAAAGVAYLSENGLPWSGTADAPGLDEGEVAVPVAAAGPPADPVQQDASSAGSAEPASVEASPGADPAAAAPAAPLPGQVVLQLRFATDSWVEIFDGSGKAVVFELGKAGTERKLTATAPLSVTLGNASGVSVTVNGRPQVPPGSAGQSLVRFSVAPDGSLR